MSSISFRPQVESLGGRCLPSGNPAMTIVDAAPAALLGTTTEHNGSDRLGGLEFSAGIFFEGSDVGVIERDSAGFGEAIDQGEIVAGVVELSVEVDDATAQTR